MAFSFLAVGWSGKQLEVATTKFTPGDAQNDDGKTARVVRFEVTAQETDQSIYEWSTSEELSVYDVPSNPTQAPYDIAPPTDLVLLSNASTAVIATDGVVTPRILATWVAPMDARVTQIQIQYQLAGAGSWTDAGAVDVATTSDYISGVIVGDTYNVQIRSLANNGATSVWVEATGVVVAAPNSLQGTYTINNSDNSNNGPYVLSQAGPTEIDLANCTASFGGATPVNYSARALTIPTPGTPTWYYVTIADPTQQGESSATLTATCQTSNALVGVQGNTYMGAILAVPDGSAVQVLPGGWPAPFSFQVGN
jgi:hypothetical protein